MTEVWQRSGSASAAADPRNVMRICLYAFQRLMSNSQQGCLDRHVPGTVVGVGKIDNPLCRSSCAIATRIGAQGILYSVINCSMAVT